tara:strand:- start:13 stop:168 length:156 start_codon:yes stop_codon:yes gene_type:complete
LNWLLGRLFANGSVSMPFLKTLSRSIKLKVEIEINKDGFFRILLAKKVALP